MTDLVLLLMDHRVPTPSRDTESHFIIGESEMCFTLLLQSYPRSLELFTVVLAMSYKATEPTLVIGGVGCGCRAGHRSLCSLAALGVDC